MWQQDTQTGMGFIFSMSLCCDGHKIVALIQNVPTKWLLTLVLHWETRHQNVTCYRRAAREEPTILAVPILKTGALWEQLHLKLRHYPTPSLLSSLRLSLREVESSAPLLFCDTLPSFLAFLSHSHRPKTKPRTVSFHLRVFPLAFMQPPCQYTGRQSRLSVTFISRATRGKCVSDCISA